MSDFLFVKNRVWVKCCRNYILNDFLLKIRVTLNRFWVVCCRNSILCEIFTVVESEWNFFASQLWVKVCRKAIQIYFYCRETIINYIWWRVDWWMIFSVLCILCIVYSVFLVFLSGFLSKEDTARFLDQSRFWLTLCRKSSSSGILSKSILVDILSKFDFEWNFARIECRVIFCPESILSDIGSKVNSEWS